MNAVTTQPLARSVGIGGSTPAVRTGFVSGGTAPIGNHRVRRIGT